MDRQNLFQKLQPKYKDALLKNKKEYPEVIDAIVSRLENAYYWGDLSISEISTLDTFADCESYKWGSWTWQYGEGIIAQDDK